MTPDSFLVLPVKKAAGVFLATVGSLADLTDPQGLVSGRGCGAALGADTTLRDRLFRESAKRLSGEFPVRLPIHQFEHNLRQPFQTSDVV